MYGCVWMRFDSSRAKCSQHFSTYCVCVWAFCSAYHMLNYQYQFEPVNVVPFRQKFVVDVRADWANVSWEIERESENFMSNGIEKWFSIVVYGWSVTPPPATVQRKDDGEHNRKNWPNNTDYAHMSETHINCHSMYTRNAKTRQQQQQQQIIFPM